MKNIMEITHILFWVTNPLKSGVPITLGTFTLGPPPPKFSMPWPVALWGTVCSRISAWHAPVFILFISMALTGGLCARSDLPHL